MVKTDMDGLLIVGLARNCEHSLLNSVKTISLATASFSHVYWLVIESDSDDKTVRCLSDISVNKDNFDFQSLGTLSERFPLRTERIAYCRNMYLSELENNIKYKDINYLVVADLDGVNVKLTKEGFDSCWDYKNWDVCTANQSGPYYDIWALRHPVWNPIDCWEVNEFYKEFGVSSYYAYLYSVLSKMLVIDKNKDLIRVDSAFGGLAVYNRRVLTDCCYSGVNVLGNEVCEHVFFHTSLALKNHANIFINPKLINCGFINHNKFLFPGMRHVLRFKTFLFSLLSKK